MFLTVPKVSKFLNLKQKKLPGFWTVWKIHFFNSHKCCFAQNWQKTTKNIKIGHCCSKLDGICYFTLLFVKIFLNGVQTGILHEFMAKKLARCLKPREIAFFSSHKCFFAQNFPKKRQTQKTFMNPRRGSRPITLNFFPLKLFNNQ